MRYYVSTILNSQSDTAISGDTLFLENRKIKINGVEHSLYYGDIVQHGDDSFYFINEHNITKDQHEYTVEDVWNLNDGEVPDDGNRYFLVVEEETNYEYTLKNYIEHHHKIVSRIGRNLTIHETQNVFYNRQLDTPYRFGVDGSGDAGIWEINTYPHYLQTVAEHEEEELNSLVGSVSQEDDLLQIISERVEVKDGKDGQDGRPGRDGKDGRDGADGPMGKGGSRGLRGSDGRDGKTGAAGRDGIGETGPRGPIGDQGPIGETGPRGSDGNDGATGADGKMGKTGERGPPGKTLIEEVEDPKTAKSFAAFKKEFAQFKKVDALYKDRLNVQLGSLGGGGSSKILDNDDVKFNKAAQLANNDFLVFDKSINKFVANNLVTIINTIKAELEVQYDKLVDEQAMGANTFTYVGEASPGSNTSVSVWRIKRIAEYANGYLEIIWANDTELFDKDWTIRGTYTYTV